MQHDTAIAKVAFPNGYVKIGLDFVAGRPRPLPINAGAHKDPDIAAARLIGFAISHGRNFVGRRGELMYERARAKRGGQLRRIGATGTALSLGRRRFSFRRLTKNLLLLTEPGIGRSNRKGRFQLCR
jgi:hypothetical protein